MLERTLKKVQSQIICSGFISTEFSVVSKTCYSMKSSVLFAEIYWLVKQWDHQNLISTYIQTIKQNKLKIRGLFERLE